MLRGNACPRCSGRRARNIFVWLGGPREELDDLVAAQLPQRLDPVGLLSKLTHAILGRVVLVVHARD